MQKFTSDISPKGQNNKVCATGRVNGVTKKSGVVNSFSTHHPINFDKLMNKKSVLLKN